MDTVEFDIVSKDKASQPIEQVNRSLDKLDNCTKSASTGMAGMWKQMLAGQAAFTAVYQGAMKIIQGLDASVQAYISQEKADRMLQTALKVTGQYTREGFEDLKNYASEIQKLTTVTDDEAEETMRLGISMGVASKDIKEATKYAIGLSKAYGVDLQSAMKMVSLAMEGDFNLMQRTLPQLKSVKTEAEKSAIAFKALGEAWELAIEEAKTDPFDRLNDVLGELQEKVGESIVRGLIPALESLVTWIEENQESIFSFFTILSELLKATEKAGEWMFKGFLNMGNLSTAGMDKWMMDVGREQAESLKKLNETRSILDNLGFDKIKTKLSEIFDPKNQAEYNLKLQQSAGMLLHFYGIIKEQTKIIRTGKAKIEILPVEDIREQIALIEHYEQVLKDFTKNGGEGLEGLAEAYEDLVEKGDPYTQQLIKQQNELEEFKKEVDKACDDIQKLGGLFIDLAGAMGLSSEASSYLSDALNSITSGLQAAASGDLIGVITSAISIHIDAISQLIDDLSRSNEEILEDWQAIIDEGLEGSREMWDLMREMEEEGMEVAEVQDYIAEKIQKGISALNNYYNYAATSQERFNNAQVYTLAMFSALIAQGATFIEAVLEMQDEFQRLAEIVSEMGYETAAAFDFLLDFSEWIEANQDLVNAAQAVGDILDSVFESGIYNLTQLQAIIYTVGADLYDMFYGAIGAGATREEAWALIIPQLNDLIYYSQEYGLKIDQQTAELIAAAQAEGYLTELMIPVEEKQVWLLEEILLVLGGTIPYLSGIFDNTLSGKFPGLPDEGGEGGGEDFNFPHEFAEGGRFWAHRPTTITVGEGGESEFVSITPRSKISSDSGKNLSVALTVGGINLYGGQNPDDVIRALKNSIIENKFDITSIITDKVLEYVN